MAWAACGKASPGGDGRGLERAVLLTAALAVSCRDVAPGQVLELGIQAGLVLFRDQDVVRLFVDGQKLECSR